MSSWNAATSPETSEEEPLTIAIIPILVVFVLPLVGLSILWMQDRLHPAAVGVIVGFVSICVLGVAVGMAGSRAWCEVTDTSMHATSSFGMPREISQLQMPMHSLQLVSGWDLEHANVPHIDTVMELDVRNGVGHFLAWFLGWILLALVLVFVKRTLVKKKKTSLRAFLVFVFLTSLWLWGISQDRPAVLTLEHSTITPLPELATLDPLPPELWRAFREDIPPPTDEEEDTSIFSNAHVGRLHRYPHPVPEEPPALVRRLGVMGLDEPYHFRLNERSSRDVLLLAELSHLVRWYAHGRVLRARQLAETDPDRRKNLDFLWENYRDGAPFPEWLMVKLEGEASEDERTPPKEGE